ncbi:roquin-1 isoform X2 [Plodia interpunctella]|uniref:roquin-1 isoform X2 n=1 Tax=Plodia interpunctella TaxID=58824 RepID=UPI00236889C8|nr:roquin-1 isoform X2 [Plodia interpunctella]
MPIQAPQWTDYLNCPVCCREFGPPPRSPISLGCGHTLCRHCLKHLHRKQCPFDQTVIQVDLEELVVNTALLQLAGYPPPAQPYHPPSIQALSEAERQAYDVIVRSMEHLAVYLKFCGNANNSTGSRLSRPMQRKLVTLLQCAVTDEEGRGRAARAARSLGERTVTELILQHQNPQQLSANLWAAVRARGCQFLGPAMQEEVLKLVLLALEDGSALSRKVLVMFVVQRLEPHFPQASKTSIGHVVQLLYRASCFKVSKRECDSSLMQLKEEFRTYESLRREHDAQIVQIATEAGLRIAPDQWSALLYGDTTHKSHMQSIIDKLQTPQSFAQSVQELFIALQRTGDPAQLGIMSRHLDRLASIDASPDAKSPQWKQLADVMDSLKEVVSGLIHYLQQQSCRDANHNQKERAEPSNQPSPQTAASTPTHTKYKVSMCRDAATRSFCPRGNTCTFAHSEEELERYRAIPAANQTNGNYPFMPPLPATMPLPPAMTQLPLPPPTMFPRFPMPPHHLDNYNVPPMPTLPTQPLPDMLPKEYPPDTSHTVDGVITPSNYPTPLIHNAQININQNGIMIPVAERPFYGRYNKMVVDASLPKLGWTQCPVYPVQGYQIENMPQNLFVPVKHEPQRNASPYSNVHSAPSEDYLLSDYRIKPSFPAVPPERRADWPPNSNDIFSMRHTVPHCSSTSEDMFNVSGDRLAVGADRLIAMTDRLSVSDVRADDELEKELQALERRIDTEFKSTD